MANWVYNASEYTARNFEVVPEGDHRVRILDVTEKVYSTGNEGFQITLEVAGYSSRLWYNLILDMREPQKTNQRLGMFFDSFGITDYSLNSYHGWIGKEGAVRVRHNSYNGRTTPTVAFCLGRSQQGRLPEWGKANASCESRNIFTEPVNSKPVANPASHLRFDGFKDGFKF